MSGASNITARRYPETARTNKTAHRRPHRTATGKQAKCCSGLSQLQEEKAFTHDRMPAVREQQAEAARLDAAIAKNLKELGYGG